MCVSEVLETITLTAYRALRHLNMQVISPQPGAMLINSVRGVARSPRHLSIRVT